MKKVIAVNTRILVSGKLEGIGNFTAEIFKRLVKWNPDYEFHFIFNYPFDDEFIFGDNVTAHVIQPPAKHPLLVKIWYNFSLKRVLKKIKPDVFVSPDAITSLTTDVKTLTVMHDIGFAHRPQDLPLSWSKFYNKYSKRFAQKSNRIATVSEYSKKDIIKTYKINPDKIDVVFNGVKESFHPASPQKITELTNNQEYFFYIGSLHPRKNIINLLKGFNQFKQKSDNNVKLVIGGDFLFQANEIKFTLNDLEHKSQIILTGRLTDEELNTWLSGAIALSYIPHFEGFGIPLLEAMKCNTPILTSNVTSLPEVGSDAAIYVNPESIKEIAEGMNKLYTDKNLRAELIENGQKRLKNFSWEKSAKLLWDCIQKTIHS
ncbi:MAG: glycosyltransferase [Flavobacteriales bacterium]|nr:glycosyltransferase [Flavobacteriales bacterium]